MRVVVIRWDNITEVYKKFYPGHKWLLFEAQAERSKARALKKPRVPRVKFFVH